MLHKIKNKLLNLAMLLLIAVPAVAPATVLAADPTGSNATIQGSLCEGAKNLSVSGADKDTTATCTNDATGGETKVNALIKKVINIFSVIVGVVAVIMIIIGGFRYITSAGGGDKVKNAKNTILYALIGLVIVALAQVVVRYVLTQTV